MLDDFELQLAKFVMVSLEFILNLLKGTMVNLASLSSFDLSINSR